MNVARWRPAFWAAGAIVFVVVATANGGGYRYGVSDQAVYIPVTLRVLNPAAFPRDAALIDAQGRLMVFDEMVAAVVRTTGISLEAAFAAGYLLCFALAWLALVLIGARVFPTPWGTVALGALFTLRHRIPRTSANSFEPYFYPRMLAFAIGLLAIAAILHRRVWLALLLVGAVAAVHITTGLWFAVLIGVAAAVLNPAVRRLSLAGTVAAAAAIAWAILAGPLGSAPVRMDAAWLTALQSKDSLFATGWPVWAWVANLALPAVLWRVHRIRADRGTATAEDGALVWGAIALVALFLVTLPAVGARWTLPTQLQISRIFWLVDFVAGLYLVAIVVDAVRGTPTHRLARAVAVGMLAIATGRGAYVMLVEFRERALFQVHLRSDPWQDAMQWVSDQPLDRHVLADPGHAWKYGTSVRVAAGRDVFLEETKDSALAIYSRDVAMRVTERASALGNFAALTADGAQDLARRYDLDYLVTNTSLPLPIAYANSQFRVYALSPDGQAVAAPRPAAPAARTEP